MKTTEEMLRSREEFFYGRAGYSYDPKTETQEEGRRRCARVMAEAELWAREKGYGFSWEVDQGIDSSDFDDEEPPYSLWCCDMYDDKGKVVGSLGGVDFGRDKEPWGDSYRIVVEAELASEEMSRKEKMEEGEDKL